MTLFDKSYSLKKYPVEKQGICPGVPSEVLDPVNTWADKEAYKRQAEGLLGRFRQDFERFSWQVADNLRNVM